MLRICPLRVLSLAALDVEGSWKGPGSVHGGGPGGSGRFRGDPFLNTQACPQGKDGNGLVVDTWVLPPPHAQHIIEAVKSPSSQHPQSEGQLA